MTPSFTGFQRQRTSTRRVRVGDRVARWVVTAGGLLTIAAVLLVCLFLLWVALPLLAGAAIQPAGTAPSTAGKAHLLHQQVDRYRQVAWQLFDDGHVRAFAIRSGELLADASAYDPAQVADAVVHGDTEHGDTLLLARHDGRVATVRIAVTADPVAIEQAPAKARALAEGASLRIDDAVWQRTPGQLRRQGLQVRSGEVLELGTVPVARADFVDGGAGCVIAAVTTDRRLHLHAVSSRHNLITDEDETVMTGGAVPLADIGVVHSELPDRVLLAGAGDNVYLLWNDGRLVRVDARRLEAPVHAETLDILPEHGVRMTACASLLGNGTLLVGDGRGRVRALFRTKPARPAGRDGAQLTLAHEFTAGTAAAVTSIAVSAQSRLLLVGYADGWLRLFHGTSERLMAEVHTPDAAPVLLATLAPMDDGILAVTDQGIASFDLRPGHPEVTLASIALPVWYEGASGPEHVWQATGGNDFEPKFGLWPLVFGTLKATLYCLLFGVPLALLAAIYTSEFLHPRRRAKVKPLLEMMASLPSVVLGFLAAMVFAPLVERHLLTILAAFAAVPLCWLLGAQATQALPQRWRLFAERWRLPLALVTLLLSLLFAEALGRVTQALLFGGDFQRWLAAEGKPVADPARGSAYGGLALAALPLTAIAAALLVGRSDWCSRHRSAGFLRLGLGLGVTIVLAAIAALALHGFGLDLRGDPGLYPHPASHGLLGTYVQRNALVVGFVMGFAVIPIIYTIAEDALTAVPEHLRAASLGAGATPWQTAVRIILPTALSGIFSAVMVGLGRAVGETMIVLMAAGNTPVLDLNLFNGFRTLSANIAVELPEAVRNSTHYRMLYLAALFLFAVTFALNTVAELVRQRFRRRAWQL